MTKTIPQLIQAYTNSILQDFRNLLTDLKNNGYSIGTGGEEFLSYMIEVRLRIQEYIKEQEQMLADYESKAKKCPICGRAMKCYPVNNKPGNQIGGNWKSQWRCIPCDFDDFSKFDFKVELKNHGIG